MRRDRPRRGFPALIYERRRELKMTQDEVARKIGVHANYIGYLEKGVRRPSSATLTALCRLMNLDRRKVLLALRPMFKDIVIGANDGPRGQALPALLEELRKDSALRRKHRISDEDIRNLTVLSEFGEVRDKAGYIQFLNTMRETTMS
mgnify:CR=1 FL=1